MSVSQTWSTREWTYPYCDGSHGSWSSPWCDHYEDKSGSSLQKRKKPVGADLIFNQTEWYKNHYTMKDGVHMYPTYYLYCPPSYAPVLTPIPAGVCGPLGITPVLGTSKRCPDASNELLLKIKGQKVNVGMVIAEYKQTCNMFVSAANDLANIYRGIRKGKFKQLLAKGIASAPDTWMMYRYGVTPMLSDVSGALDMLDNRDREKTMIQRHSVTRNMRWTDQYPVYYAGFIVGNQRDEFHVREKSVAYVEYTSSDFESATSLGLTNPLLLAWEVIPYSFVVDWFIGVGDYLSSLDALVGTTRTGASRTTKTTIKSRCLAADMTGKTYARVPFYLTPQLPSWEPSMNWKRVVDSTIMLRNLRK